MKRFACALMVSLLGWVLVPHPPGTAAEPKPKETPAACFRWAFFAMTGSESNRALLPVTRDTVLRTGDRLKIFVEPRKPCFVYVFHQSGEDEIRLLFPYTLQMLGSDYAVAQRYYIPRGNAWFQLDERVGMETFHVLASEARLTRLERLYQDCESAQPAEKQVPARRLIAEILAMRQKGTKLESAAERPVPIAGNVRAISDDEGALPDIEPIAQEISFTGFYGRAFTIDHR